MEAEQLTLLSFYMVSRKSAFGKCLENRLAANVDFKALNTKSESVSSSADAGYYTAAKILNAAAASLTNRRLYAESLPKTDDDLAAALSAIEPALAEAQLDPQLLAALRQAAPASATDHIILQRDAPTFWV